MSSSTNKFEIWVELDEFETIEEQDIDKDYCNAIVLSLQHGLNFSPHRSLPEATTLDRRSNG
jgi:hypothetical protein